MALGAGLAAQIGIATEVTNGTQLAVTRFVEFNPPETMTMGKNVVQGQGLRAPATGSGGGPAAGSSLFERASRRVVASWEAKGGFNLDIPFSGLGLYLEHMMGAFTPGTVGGTNNPLVVQQGGTTAWLQTYAPGSLAGKTFCMQVGKPDSGGTVRPFTYVGCKVTDWEVAFDLNQFAKLQLGIDAWQELTPDNPQGTTAGQALSAAVYTSAQQFFQFRQGMIFNGGTLSTSGGITTLSSPVGAARVLKGAIKVTNPLDMGRFFVGGPFLAAPAAPVPTTATTGGTVAAGTYGAIVTYVNAYGETTGSAAGSVVTTGSTSTITVPSPAASGNATGWYAYVTQAGGTTYTRQQAAGSPTAIAVNLTLTAPPTSSGANPPTLNTTGPAGVKAEQLENNYRLITGSLDVEFFNLATYYDVAAGDTNFALWLEFVGPVIASTFAYTFAILIPNCRIDAPFTPTVQNPGVLQHTLPIKGLDDETNNQIQIQYQSTDTAP